MSKQDRLYVRVTSDEKAAAEAVAEARGVTVSDLIRASLARMAKAQQAKDAVK